MLQNQAIATATAIDLAQLIDRQITDIIGRCDFAGDFFPEIFAYSFVLHFEILAKFVLRNRQTVNMRLLSR